MQAPPLRNDVEMEDAGRVTKQSVDSGSRDGDDMAGRLKKHRTRAG